MASRKRYEGAVYSKVDRRIWGDFKFRSLSDDAKLLFLYLLTAPESLPLPGFFIMGKAQLAESMGWLPERLSKPFEELFRNGMVKCDWEARFLFLTNGIKRNPPDNPNVVKGWARQFDKLPECNLKEESLSSIIEYLETLGKRYLQPFTELLPKPFAKPLSEQKGNGLRNQDQEQDQEHDQERSDFSKSSLSQKENEKEEQLKQKKKAGNKKHDEVASKKNVVPKLPDGDLFELPDSEHKEIVELLETKQKEDFETKRQRLILDELQRLVLSAYGKVKERKTGNGYNKLGKHGEEAAQKIGIGCVAFRIKPEDVIDYWVENNFTDMSFPTLLFISSGKNMERASAGLKGNNRRRKGYHSINEKFEDDSEDDSEELLLLAREAEKRRKAARRNNDKKNAYRTLRNSGSVTRGRRKDVS